MNPWVAVILIYLAGSATTAALWVATSVYFKSKHKHTWKLVWLRHGRQNGWPITMIGDKCRECNTIRTRTVDGTWDKEELNA